ncbi:c-type cytochrome [Variovorax sp. N23]|uniref:c-type cytochrome n=1 Tax=Variovorax sp. N23 TaxID=2980555 RepID=UPI0021C8FDC4|nr:c-type cytochrome [Variovorax sp. N23]MCU4119265.1 c-type cytochrome [Variovorax sp. N23]
MKRAFAIVALSIGATAPALADLALATSKNCMSCHAVEHKVLGPSFKDIATRYKDNKAAPEQLAAKIMKGGAGVWGPIPMPANTQVSEADAKKLAAWVLSTK